MASWFRQSDGRVSDNFVFAFHHPPFCGRTTNKCPVHEHTHVSKSRPFVMLDQMLDSSRSSKSYNKKASGGWFFSVLVRKRPSRMGKSVVCYLWSKVRGCYNGFCNTEMESVGFGVAEAGVVEPHFSIPVLPPTSGVI